MTKVCVLGAGRKSNWRKNLLGVFTKDVKEWDEVDTVDCNPEVKPDILCGLNSRHWCDLESNSYDEVHAYEVLEHLGEQGNIPSFYNSFNEIYRILKPGGLLVASTPKFDSVWAFGDPGHTRVINDGSLVFVCGDMIELNKTNITAMSDYEQYRKCDFRVVYNIYTKDNYIFVLRANKNV